MRKLRLIRLIKDLAEGPAISGRIEIQTQVHEHNTLLRAHEKLEEASWASSCGTRDQNSS